MPTRSYALQPQGPKRLELSWGGLWKNFTVKLDGIPVGTIANAQALRAGQQFGLPDGSLLKVQLVQSFFSSELRVLRDGQPLPQSDSDPRRRLKNAYGVLYFIAAVNLILGVVAVLFQVELLLQLGMGYFSIIVGLVYLGLAFFTQNRIGAALIIAIVLYALDGILGIVGAVSAGVNPVTGLLVRIAFLVPMVQGVGAIKALKQEERATGL